MANGRGFCAMRAEVWIITAQEHAFLGSPMNSRFEEVHSVWRGGSMARRIFCDKCGRELSVSEVVQLLEYDLCFACCKKTLGSK